MRTRVESSSTTRGCSCAIAARRSSAFMGPERYPMTRGSRPEAFEPPRVVRSGVAEPVMEAVFPALPELDHGGLDAVAAPVRRQGNAFPGEPRVERCESGFELL